MLFHKLDYSLFLVAVLFVYWLLRRWNVPRLLFLLGASCFFYMAWNEDDRPYILLIIAATVLDFSAGLGIYHSKTRRAKKLWLLLSIAGNLGMLGTFKYYDFIRENLIDVASLFGVRLHLEPLGMLPPGISFYTFQTLAYSIDVYRGRLEPTRDFLRFANFVAFFPQLIAGPIVRAPELLPQMERQPRINPKIVSHGMFLIGTGLIKKIVFADYLSINLVDRVFDNPSAYTATEVLLGLYAFTVQIYCDFSGYTDVARGSAHLLGFTLPENFDRPYQARSPADFWRRWHMTLSSWIRDYLYFPLGGSRVSPARAYWNLWFTIFVIGIWHGASWTFVLYGMVQGTAMVIHRYVYRRTRRESRVAADTPAIVVLKVVACFHFVVLSRILFRATSLKNAWEVTTQLWSGTSSTAQISLGLWAVLLIGIFAHYLPKRLFTQIESIFASMHPIVQGTCLAAVAGALQLVASSEVVPYIYFQF